MKKWQKISAVLLAGAMTVGMTGAVWAEDIAAENAAVCPGEEQNPDADQYINTYLSNEPTSLDISLRSDSYSSLVMINIFEGLVRNEERDGEYYMAPGDAQSWESNEDGTVWTFHLGDNCWSDGEPVTAEQYVYSLQRTADDDTASPNSYFLNPILNFDAVNSGEADPSELGVKALDDKTLEITLTNPTPSFISMCNATVYYPERQDLIEKYGEQYGSEAEYTACNGPFVITSWTHNSEIVLEKNPYYWDADSVLLDKIDYKIMTDETTVQAAYQSGEIDFVGVSSREYLDYFAQDEHSQLNQYATGTVMFSFFNHNDSIFSNVNIRKAFTLALDREDLNEMCYSGLRIPCYGWVVPTMSVGDVNYREAAGQMIQDMIDEMEAEGMTAKDYLLKGMEELGLGDDPSTLDITFSLAGTSDWYHTMGEYLQQVYGTELGIDLHLSFNEWSIFYANVLDGNYQIGFMSWGAYYNDPYDVLSLFTSDYDAIATGWANDEFDALIEKSASEMDESARLQEYIDAETILLKDECVVCPVAASRTAEYVKDYVYAYGELGFSSVGFKYTYTSGR